MKQGTSGTGEEGVLTALEVAGLDLWGTRLVVLLACKSKKENYTFRQSSVRRQARQIAGIPGRGIVIDYRRDGFMAVDAWAVSQADRQGLIPTPLGDVLAEEFVGCSRGSSAYFYDPDRETINFPIANGSFVWRTFPVANLIRTRFMQQRDI